MTNPFPKGSLVNPGGETAPPIYPNAPGGSAAGATLKALVIDPLAAEGLGSWPATVFIGLAAVGLLLVGVWSLVGGTTVQVVTTAAKAAK